MVTAAAKIVKNNEMKADSQKLAKKADVETKQEKHLPWSKKLMVLAQLLWGGAFLLCFEHIWHGEIVPYFPFLTAMYDPSDTAEMLQEMATAGVGMAVLITAVWAVMCVAADAIAKRSSNTAKDTVG